MYSLYYMSWEFSIIYDSDNKKQPLLYLSI